MNVIYVNVYGFSLFSLYTIFFLPPPHSMFGCQVSNDVKIKHILHSLRFKIGTISYRIISIMTTMLTTEIATVQYIIRYRFICSACQSGFPLCIVVYMYIFTVALFVAVCIRSNFMFYHEMKKCHIGMSQFGARCWLQSIEM